MVKKRKYIIVYIILYAIFIILLIFRFQYLPPQIPLLFSKLEGDDQLVDTWMISILPLSSLVLLWVNRFIKKHFIEDDYIKNIFEYVGWGSSMTLLFIAIYILLLVT